MLLLKNRTLRRKNVGAGLVCASLYCHIYMRTEIVKLNLLTPAVNRGANTDTKLHANHRYNRHNADETKIPNSRLHTLSFQRGS